MKSHTIDLLENLRGFLETAVWPNGHSGGNCVETSLLVAKVLNETSDEDGWKADSGFFIMSTSIFNAWHCWVAKDNIIIDLTADQFGSDFPKILITDRSDSRYRFCSIWTDPNEQRTCMLYNQWKLEK